MILHCGRRPHQSVLSIPLPPSQHLWCVLKSPETWNWILISGPLSDFGVMWSPCLKHRMRLSILKVLSKKPLHRQQNNSKNNKAFQKRSFEYKLHIIIHDNSSYFAICQFQSVLSIGGVVVWTVFLGTFQGSDHRCDDGQNIIMITKV